MPQGPKHVDTATRTAIHHPIRIVTSDLTNIARDQRVNSAFFLKGEDCILVAPLEWLLNNEYKVRETQSLRL
jgi:hypothetical protein